MSTKRHQLAGKTLTRKIWLAICVKHIDFAYITIFDFDPSTNDADWIVLEPRDLEYLVPDDFDPTAAQVAALLSEKAKLTAEFTAAVSALNRKLSELQAIEFDSEAA